MGWYVQTVSFEGCHVIPEMPEMTGNDRKRLETVENDGREIIRNDWERPKMTYYKIV